MTDFRPVWCLRAYSGGTVPVSHRIPYSLLSHNASQQHLNAYVIINIIILITRFVKMIESFWYYEVQSLWANQNSREIALDILVCNFMDALAGKPTVGYDGGFLFQSPLSNGSTQFRERFGAFHQHLAAGSIQRILQIGIGTGENA